MYDQTYKTLKQYEESKLQKLAGVIAAVAAGAGLIYVIFGAI